MSTPNTTKVEPAPAATTTPAIEISPPPVTPPEAAPAVETAPEIKTGKDDPLLAALFSDMREEPEIVKVNEETAVEPEAAATPPPTEPVKEEPKKRKKRVDVVVEQEQKEEPAPATATAPEPAPPAAKEEAKDDEAEYISGLNDDQKDELSEAEWAEKNLGDKFKGRRKAVLDWFKKIDKAAQDNPNRTFDAEDEEFQKILKEKPAFDKSTGKKILMGIAEERASERVRKEMDAKIKEQDARVSDLTRQTREVKLKPQLDAVMTEFSDGVTELLSVSEKDSDTAATVASAMRMLKENPEKARAEYGAELEIIESAKGKAAEIAREYTLFANEVKKFDPKNPTHGWLYDFINHECDVMDQRGGKAKIKKTPDGATQNFVTRKRYAEIAKTAPDELRKVWTYSHRDVLELIAFNAKAEIESSIKSESEWAAKRGYTRQKSAQADPTKKGEATALNPPRSKSTPANGPGSERGTGLEGQSVNGINVVNVLKMRS